MAPLERHRFTGSAVLAPDAVGTNLPVPVTRQMEMRWHFHVQPSLRIYHIASRQDDEGCAVCTYCLELPGAIAEAQDLDASLALLRKVFDDLVDAYRQSGAPVPWIPREPEDGDELVDSITLDG